MARATGRIPLFIARGSHYEVGLQVGRAYHYQILYYLNHHDWLEKYETFYKTPEGAKFCQGFWDVWEKDFPQYVQELMGLADGASIDLLQVKLLHLDRELATHLKLFQDVFTEAKGCTDILLANDKHTIIGHNEDWIANMNGRDILLIAHILPWTSPDGRKFPEERFFVHTWPGLLPGMNSGINKNGLVFSIDHLFPKKVATGKLADLFLCRHLLTACSLNEVESILTDEGRGAAVGFTANIGFKGSKTLYSFELGPSINGATKTPLHKTTVESKKLSCYAHFNNYEHLKSVEALTLVHCLDRQKCWTSMPPCKDLHAVRDALGNDVSQKHPIYQKYTDDKPSCTVASVILDIGKENVLFFQHNPRDAEPLICVPFCILDTVS